MTTVNELQRTITSDYSHQLFSCYLETTDNDLIDYVCSKDPRYHFYFKSKKISNNYKMPEIKDVIFNDPATIVFWKDGTKTIVKANGKYNDEFSKETGLAMAICKKAFGNKGNFNEVFKKWAYED